MKEPLPLIDLYYYTDPYCTWCWGSEPMIREIQEVYGDQVKIVYKMGGLVEDMDKFYDPLNKIRTIEQVAPHWREASERHGMPVDEIVFYEIKDSFKSTYPANIAYKTAQFQGEELATKFLRRMREAAAAERKQIHKTEVLVELAAEVGLDSKRFLEDFERRGKEAFYQDLNEARSQGITGFPTFLIKNRKGEARMLVGYRSFETFERVFQELAGKLKKREITDDTESILGFIKKYGKVASKEVAEVFNLSLAETEEKLSALEKQGKIEKMPAGNGNFWLLAPNKKIT